MENKEFEIPLTKEEEDSIYRKNSGKFYDKREISKEHIESLKEDYINATNSINKVCMKQLEDKKYFTPEIEDLFVGYECECFDRENWNLISIQIGDFYTIDHTQQLRAPFLTKEQIEREGWVEEGYYKGGKSFTKNGHNLSLGSGDERGVSIPYIRLWVSQSGISIYKYQGKCPSINEFRKICKLIGIQ